MLCSLSILLQTIQVKRLLVHASCLTQQQQQQAASEPEGPKGMTIRLKPPMKLARKMQAAQASAALQTACSLPAMEVLQAQELGFTPATPWVMWELTTCGLFRDLHCAAGAMSTAIMFKQLVPGPPPALPPMPPSEPSPATGAAQHASQQQSAGDHTTGQPGMHELSATATAAHGEDDMEVDAAEHQPLTSQVAATVPQGGAPAGVPASNNAAVAVVAGAKAHILLHQEQLHLPSVVDLLEEGDEVGGI
jgi:hypothetical protein